MKKNLFFKIVTMSFIVSISFTKLLANNLPNVVILATGGTIAGSAKLNTSTTGYKAGALGVQTLINAVPEIKNLANVSGEQIANTGSPNVTSDILLTLSKRINELLASDNIDGVIVTHGTDTLEETAYYLNLTVKSNKPIVIIGSMRPATAISADGPFNLYEAVQLAASKKAKGKGAFILLNDRIGSARYVTKTNATSLDTFKSFEQGYLGEIAGGKIYFWNNITKRHTVNSEFNTLKLEKLPKVDILYSYQDMDPIYFETAVKTGAKGIIIAGSGDGSLSKIAKKAAKEAEEKGLIVIRSTRTGNGIVTPKEGWINSNSLNPQKSRILLMLALTKTHDTKEIQRIFDEY